LSATDSAKAFADFWTAQGQAFVTAQQQAGKAFADGMQALASGKIPAMPEMSTDLSAATADLARASQSVSAMWSAATAMFGGLAAAPSSATGDSAVEATFRKMVDPRSWMGGTGEMDDVLGRIAEGPRFADLWEAERRYARVLQAWMTVRRTGLEHNAVVLEAWTKAAGQFCKDLAERAGANTQVPDAKQALALWTDIANRHLLEAQHSEPFLRTQAAMIRASTDLRMAQQDLVEHFGKQYGFPTRTELDDVHRTVTELRREMRAMRRGEQTATASVLAQQSPAAAASARRLPVAHEGTR
jgi:class III poly(R)-hydroxyalkanoic acid synthase PhaE subunit